MGRLIPFDFKENAPYNMEFTDGYLRFWNGPALAMTNDAQAVASISAANPAKVATYAYVNPIVAVLLGALFAHETLSLRTRFAAGLIIGSVALVITAQQLKPKAAPPITAAVEPTECVR